MEIKKVTQILLFIVFTNSICAQKKHIEIPEIESPEAQFISIFQKDKIDNPIFLSGKVEAVHKKHVNFINPKRKEKVIANFYYKLNNNSEVINYKSDVEFDEMKIDFLNAERKLIIKNDTVINQDNSRYTFNSKNLISKTTKTLDEANYNGFIDSIQFVYKKNKLQKIIQYQKEVFVEVDEETYEENLIVSSDYFITSYGEANYKKTDLESKLEIGYEPNAMVLFVEKTDYKYNSNNQLESFIYTSNDYEIVVNDLNNYIKKIKQNKLTEIPFESKETKGIYLYDRDNRVVKLEIINKKLENQVYTMVYNTNETIITRQTKGLIDTEYNFIYDINNNPIQEKRYIFIDGNKYLDTQTTIDITYFK